MKKYELEQARMNAGRSAIHQPEPEIYMPDIDMESVGSRLSRSHDYGREHLDQGNKRLPHVATAWAADDGGFSNQIIRMSAMDEVKELDGREKNEERARNWIRKVKSSFLRDQAPDADQYLVFSDLLTGPTRDWYNRSAARRGLRGRHSGKASWPNTEGRMAFRLGDSTTKPVSDQTRIQWSTYTV